MEFLKNYNSFLPIERSDLFYDVILESIVVYKDKFKDILSEMETPLSKEILNIERKDIETRNNYFTPTKSNDSIGFIPDRKYQDIIKSKDSWMLKDPTKIVTKNIEKYPGAKKIWDGLGLEVPLELKVESGMKGNIKGSRGSGNPVTGKTGKQYYGFYPLDKKIPPFPVNHNAIQRVTAQQIEDELTKSTQEIKVGRGMKALLGAAGINTTDKEIEEFVNKFKSTYDVVNNAFRFFDIVEGEDIRKYYYEGSYESNTKGQLGNSCMKKGVCGDFLDIYCKNPEKCKLVILRAGKTGKIKGRALLWKLDDPAEGCEAFLDRIYTNNDSDINLFIEFSKKNGWICKKQQAAGKTLMILPSGKESRDWVKLKVTLNPEIMKYRMYPYLDTLKCYIPEIHLLTNDETIEPKKMCLELSQPNGTYSWRRHCSGCGGSRIIYCKECGGEGSIRCKECNGTGRMSCKNCTMTANEARNDPRFKIGSYIKTNADGSGCSDVIEGEISDVSYDYKFRITTRRGGWNIKYDNKYAWIVFIEDPEKICPECGDRHYLTCTACKGEGRIKCKVCNGKGGDPCPDCAPYI